MGRVIGPGSHADLQVAPDPGEGLLDSLGRERDLRVRGAMGVRGVSGVSGVRGMKVVRGKSVAGARARWALCHTDTSHTAMSRTELTRVTLCWGHTVLGSHYEIRCRVCWGKGARVCVRERGR